MSQHDTNEKGDKTMNRLVFLLILIPLTLSHAQGELPRLTAYVLDVSASMKKHGFNEAKEALINDIKRMTQGDVAFIIPFAENEREIKRIEYDDIMTPNITSVERFIRHQIANGQFTNIDEGIDAAKVKLMEQPREAKRTIILISDGISDPDHYHNAIRLEALAKRIPKGIFSFYFIDLSNNRYPRFPASNIGTFTSFSQPDTALTVLPLRDVSKMQELLAQLSEQRKHSKQNDSEKITEPESKNQDFSRSLSQRYTIIALLIVLALATAILLLLILRGNNKHKPPLFEGVEIETEEEGEKETDKGEQNETLYVKVNNTEKRFGIPVMLTIGSGQNDDFKVHGAIKQELTIMVSDDEGYFKQRTGFGRKEEGNIFGSKSFSLRNGIPVIVKLESEKKTLHRYFESPGR